MSWRCSEHTTSLPAEKSRFQAHDSGSAQVTGTAQAGPVCGGARTRGTARARPRPEPRAGRPLPPLCRPRWGSPVVTCLGERDRRRGLAVAGPAGCGEEARSAGSGGRAAVGRRPWDGGAVARGGPRAVVVVPRAEPCWEPGGAQPVPLGGSDGVGSFWVKVSL